jgi:hypothetical protein
MDSRIILLQINNPINHNRINNNNNNNNNKIDLKTIQTIIYLEGKKIILMTLIVTTSIIITTIIIIIIITKTLIKIKKKIQIITKIKGINSLV